MLRVLAPVGLTILLMVLSSISRREERRVVGENDARIAAEAERYVVQHLTDRSATDPITQHYGKFVSLSGQGHQRRAGVVNPPPLCVSRRANFEKGEVRCTRRYDRGAIGGAGVRPGGSWPRVASQSSNSLLSDAMRATSSSLRSRPSVSAWTPIVSISSRIADSRCWAFRIDEGAIELNLR